MQIHQMYGNSEIINWTNWKLKGKLPIRFQHWRIRLLISGLQIKKLGKSIFIILFNFVYVFENPVHVQMQLNKSGVIFLGLKVFIMLQRRKKNMQISHILPLNIMKDYMERVFSHWHRIICVQMACIFLTNRKLHYPRRDRELSGNRNVHKQQADAVG